MVKTTAKAAIIKSGDGAPTFKEISIPEPTKSQIQLEVLGTAIHHLVRSRALGAHYSVSDDDDSERQIGVDGVGADEAGNLYYFTAFSPGAGSFSQYVNVEKSNIYPLPDIKGNYNAIARVAVLANSAMASHLAIGARLSLKPGSTVLINGVTGSAGKTAIDVAKKSYGASKVIGVSRSLVALEELQSQTGIDEIISATEEDEETIIKKLSKFDIDAVLDFTWGDQAKLIILNLAKSRKDTTYPVSWVQIGQIGGDNLEVPGGVLRSQNFQILGSGLGSFEKSKGEAVFKQLVEELALGEIGTDLYEKIEIAQVADISEEWKAWRPNARKVFQFREYK